jgi:hypothetical protein
MKRWTIVFVVAAAAVGIWWWQGRGGGGRDELAASHDDQPADLLFDRAWIDHTPSEPTEFAEVLIVQNDDQHFGVFLKGSAYRLELEVFKYRASGRQVKMRFPQTGKRADVRYRIEECDELPPYDLCLTIDKNPWGKARRFYAERECGDHTDLDADDAAACRRADELTARAAAAAAAAAEAPAISDPL